MSTLEFSHEDIECMDLSIPVETIIARLEDDDEYRVFSDDEEGRSDARDWLIDNDCVMYEDHENAIESIKECEGVDFILDRLPTDSMVTYNVLHNPLELVEALHENRQYIIAQDKESMINHLKYDIAGIINPFDIYSVKDISYELRSSESLMEEFIGLFNPDYVLGPIESTDIITHLENSIEAMVIRKAEPCTDAIVEEMASYVMQENYGDELIIQLRSQGLSLERILRVFVEQDRAEQEREHNGY